MGAIYISDQGFVQRIYFLKTFKINHNKVRNSIRIWAKILNFTEENTKWSKAHEKISSIISH